MKRCKFCNLPVFAGNVVHSDCAEAAIDAVALADEERQELESYRALGVPADDIPGLLTLAKILKDLDEAKHLVNLVRANEEGRLVELYRAPERRPGTGNPIYVLYEGDVYEDWIADVTITRDSDGHVKTQYRAHYGYFFEDKDIGVTVFPSAEAAANARGEHA